MSDKAGPLYEMSFVIADGIRTEVEDWLCGFSRQALQTDGIEDAQTLFSESSDSMHITLGCQFQIRDDAVWEYLADGFFADATTAATAQFADDIEVHSRILRTDDTYNVRSGESSDCLNCGTQLRGQYCGHCGQRSRSRLISIWQLVREAFGDLFELDSRLWNTMRPLFARPGQLTRDYLEGRRARYMPPFRTYLVLSVVFFVVAFFNPKDDLSLLFVPEPPPTADEMTETEVTADDDSNSNNSFFEDCENASIHSDDNAPTWVAKRFTDERMRQICERNTARGVDSFGDAVLDNVPIGLVVLIPLMAFVLKLLYPLSRRYFVEHVLFFVHFHAFFFLMLILQVLFARFANALGLMESIVTIALVVSSLYIPVYLYKAMRRVYRQGHLTTIIKYVLLLAAYIAGATTTLIATLFIALMSA